VWRDAECKLDALEGRRPDGPVTLAANTNLAKQNWPSGRTTNGSDGLGWPD